MRCPGRPSLRTIPLRRLHQSAARAFHGTSWDLRLPVAPLRFFAPRMRCGCARCADNNRLRFRSVSRRHVNATTQTSARKTELSAVARAGAGRRNRRWRAQRATRHIKRHRFTNPLPEPGHAPTRSLARRSATERLEPSRPGRATGPSLSGCLGRPAALLGFILEL